MDNEMFLELVYNMIPYQDEIMDVPTDDNASMDEDEGFLFNFLSLSLFFFCVSQFHSHFFHVILLFTFYLYYR